MLPIILRLLTPKVIKAIMAYVFEKNDLDHKVEKLIERIKDLERDSHPPKNWDIKIKTLQQEIELLKEKK